jgi:hypothetical protein
MIFAMGLFPLSMVVASLLPATDGACHGVHVTP